MKTTKIKATATEKTVTTITLEIDGKKINVTKEDAKAVYDELNKVFGPKVNQLDQYKKRINDVWNAPTYPPITPYTYPKPFEITC